MRKMFAFVALVAVAVFSFVDTAEACGRRRGRCGRAKVFHRQHAGHSGCHTGNACSNGSCAR